MRRLAAVGLVLLGAIALFSEPAAAAEDETTGLTWFFSNRLSGGPADFSIRFGTTEADEMLTGDWNGDSIDDIAVRTGNRFDLFDLRTGATRTISFGRPGDDVYAADWNGDGRDTLAVRRGNVLFVSLTGNSGNADLVVGYGRADDVVYPGDWNGDGRDTLAVRRGNRMLVRNSVTSGPAEVVFSYGRPDDKIMVGDWNGDRFDSLVVRRGKSYLLRNDLVSGPATIEFGYGKADDKVVFGDWNGDGRDTPAVIRVGGVAQTPTVFATSRIVAHYGSSATPLLGVLGEGTPLQAAQRVAARAAEWDGQGRPTIPAAEFIATIANASPGPRGDWSVRVPQLDIRPYIDAMRTVGGITVLDLQPGRSDFLSQAKEYEALLLEPDVHLALDPEWRMGPGQIPARVIGSVEAAEINAVSAWLDELVEANDLPPKLLVVHQFTPFMVKNRDQLAQRPNLTLLVHLDGFGSPAAKISKFNQLRPPPPILVGFKLFIDEDTRLMSPGEVIDVLDPDPSYISYQ